ncbi:MAG: hypothetical protein NTY15_16485 [Planctomycetota bacterium]|nr:hypothetical protein [Planctomycetota bacterium]
MAELKQTRYPVLAWLIAIGVGGLVMLTALPYFVASMAIRGEEFCPQLFQKREFSYWRIPGTKVRVSRTTLTPGVSPSGKDILQYLPTSSQTDWHLSNAHQGSVSKEFGPKILIDFLQCNNADGVNFWDSWSFRNPTKAELLWPLVQQVALKEMYFCIPDMLGSSDATSDLTEFDKNLRKICLRAAKVKLKTLTDAKNTANALQLRNWGQQLTRDFSDDTEIQELGALLENL